LDGIVASEFFPANADSGFYVLTLQKGATAPTEVWKVENELVHALEFLAAAWPFSGGTHLAFDTRTVVRSARYQSNAEEVEAALLDRQGLRRVGRSVTMGYEVVGSYLQPPLEIASNIGRAMIADNALKKLMLYYQEATARTPTWFIPLYKVRESIEGIYESERKSQKQLGIFKQDWKHFGKLLNADTDLRHAKISGPPRVLTKQEINYLYQLAYTWVKAHLGSKGLLGACVRSESWQSG
jgi:hypothetical protein